MASQELLRGDRAIMRIEVLLQESQPQNNRSRLRVIARVRDGSTTLGGSGTLSWAVTLRDVAGTIGSGSVGYNFTGNSGQNLLLFDNSNVFLPHDPDGSQEARANLSISFFNSFIPDGNVAVLLPLTDYDISTANIWDGTQFQKGVPRMWDGTTFVTTTPRVWDGTTWKAV